MIAISALLGLRILDFFSISLASFQVGGGMLLLTSSLAMLNAEPAEAKSTIIEIKEAQTDSMLAGQALSGSDAGSPASARARPGVARGYGPHGVSAARTSIAVVPLDIPLLTGPATLSTAVI